MPTIKSKYLDTIYRVKEGSYITTNAYSDLTVNEEEGWKIISVETVSPQIKTIGSNDVYEVVKGDT